MPQSTLVILQARGCSTGHTGTQGEVRRPTLPHGVHLGTHTCTRIACTGPTVVRAGGKQGGEGTGCKKQVRDMEMGMVTGKDGGHTKGP